MLKIIGLASRARKVTTGTDMTISSVRNSKIKLVFLATNASDNTKKHVSDKCKHYNVEVIEEFDSIELSQATGKRNIMVVGITDNGFSKLLLDQKRK